MAGDGRFGVLKVEINEANISLAEAAYYSHQMPGSVKNTDTAAHATRGRITPNPNYMIEIGRSTFLAFKCHESIHTHLGKIN